MCISKLPSSSKFQLCSHSLDIQANSAQLTEALNLSNIPSECYEFTDVFSKTKAEVLILYHSYNLQINLDKNAQSPVGLIYSLLASKQETLNVRS